jgi:hypothetical protein
MVRTNSYWRPTCVRPGDSLHTRCHRRRHRHRAGRVRVSDQAWGTATSPGPFPETSAGAPSRSVSRRGAPANAPPHSCLHREPDGSRCTVAGQSVIQPVSWWLVLRPPLDETAAAMERSGIDRGNRRVDGCGARHGELVGPILRSADATSPNPGFAPGTAGERSGDEHLGDRWDSSPGGSG